MRSWTNADPSVPRERRNWPAFAGRIGFSAAVLSALFFFLPRDRLLDALGGFSTGVWIAGVSVYLCLHLLGVGKWRLLVNTAGGHLTFGQAARCYYYGLFGNTFLPSVVGGDIVRAGLAIKVSRSGPAVLVGSLVDRTVDSIGLFAVAGTGALLVSVSLDENISRIIHGVLVLILATGAVATILLLVLPARRFSFRMRRHMANARLAMRSLSRHPGRVLLALAAAMLLQTSQVLMNFCLGRLALIRNASLAMWLFVWPMAKLAAMAPLTQGGIGLREAAQGMLFVPLGVSIEKAVATGLIFQTIVVGGNLLAGLLAVLLGRQVRLAAQSGSTSANRYRDGRIELASALAFGGTLFFVANALAIAHGTGSVGPGWIAWTGWIPLYGPDFAGACAGFLWWDLGRREPRTT